MFGVEAFPLGKETSAKSFPFEKESSPDFERSAFHLALISGILFMNLLLKRAYEIENSAITEPCRRCCFTSI